MRKTCKQLHKILKKGKVFDFEAGKDFRAYLNSFSNFPDNGIYYMFEEGEAGHKDKRIVRIGITRQGTLAHRLNTHINGTVRNSIFRKHLFRILGIEKKVFQHIQKEISFCVINDPDNRRKEIEKKSIGEVSNCRACMPSRNWLGLKSETKRIKESGLWNVHHVFGEDRLNNNDLKYIEDNLVVAKTVKKGGGNSLFQ